MHGGRRDKWSTFYTNAPWLEVLELYCDQQHQHDSCGVTRSGMRYQFSTAEDAVYPPLLCLRIAQAAKDAALAAGIQLVTSPPAKRAKTTPFTMAAAGKQPRGNRHPELISEYQQVVQVPWPFQVPHKLPRLLTAAELQHFQLHKPAKILTCEKRGSPDVEDNSKLSERAAKLGVLKSEEEFLSEAIQLKHPFDSDFMLSDDVKRAIFDLLVLGHEEMQWRREQVFEYYSARSEQLEHAEEELHKGLSGGRKDIIRDKKLLLFQEMCKAAGVEDDGLLDLQLVGTPLTGVSGQTGLFEPASVGEPAMDDVQLMKSARWSRKMLAGKKFSATDVELNREVWFNTMREVQCGWLEGPFSEQQLADRFGPLYIASPRFGLKQSDKVRPIDDMTVSLATSWS